MNQEHAQSYPLYWPETLRRRKEREKSQFKTSYSRAEENVIGSLNRFSKDSGKAVEQAIVSSNMSLMDKTPADPGIALWFKWDGMMMCIAVDRYTTPAENLQAIHHVIEARRTELRHGTLELVRASFQGFRAALPAPGQYKKQWWQVLGVQPSDPMSKIELAFRARAKAVHPDVDGGSEKAMRELNEAYAEAKASFNP